MYYKKSLIIIKIGFYYKYIETSCANCNESKIFTICMYIFVPVCKPYVQKLCNYLVKIKTYY